MQLHINGEAKQLNGATTVAALVEQLQLDVRTIAIERNREIVSRERYADTALADGDQLEIIGFIGGG